METTVLNLESNRCVNALERILPQHGYRTLRSFDLHPDRTAASLAGQAVQRCQCGCEYTVLLVFANVPRVSLEGTIAVRGDAERSYVSLTAPDDEGEFAALFPTMLVEVVQAD